MPTFVTFANWTDQGIRAVKEAPGRAEAAKELLRGLGGEVKQLFVVTGRYDIVLVSEAPDGEVMARFALALGARGNVRTETVRAFSEDDFATMVADLP